VSGLRNLKYLGGVSVMCSTLMTGTGVAGTNRVETLLASMTLEEKIAQLHAYNKFCSGGVERLGIPPIVMSDGPNGVRGDMIGTTWNSANRPEDKCTYLPVGTVLAATWNPAMARLHGEVLGAEARFRGKDIILSPGINLIRTPLNGRNFEYQSEDPFLIASMVVPQVQGIQSQDVAACVKHFVANNQELNRFQTDARIDERTLQEMYLPGFRAAVVEGQVYSIMCAFNRLRGVSCATSPDLTRILREDWKSEAVYITDWNVLNMDTLACARSGLDIEMGTTKPFNEYYMADPLLKAVRQGLVPEEMIDEKVRRILSLMEKTKMLDPVNRKPGAFVTQQHSDAAREIAREGIVLLRNENEALPLIPKKTKHIVVVGANATAQHHAGGGSSEVPAKYEITPLEGLKKRFGPETVVDYFPGFMFSAGTRMETIPPEVLVSRAEDSGIPAWKVEFFSNLKLEGQPVKTVYEGKVDFQWGEKAPFDDLPADGFSARASAVIQPKESGSYRFFAGSDDGSRLFLDGKMVVDNWRDQGYHVEDGTVELEAGRNYEVVVEYFEGSGNASWKTGWLTPAYDKLIRESEQPMLAAAAKADAVLFFGGLSKLFDGEGGDRIEIKLPSGQDELIAKLAKINRNTQVYLVAGGAVNMPWQEDVSAIVWVGYAGMETGHALAELVAGDSSPSGRMPFSLPKRIEDIGAHALDAYKADVCEYKEGIFVGYRWLDRHGIEPLYPFGHGLGYTRFEYSDIKVSSDQQTVSFSVTNSGRRRAAAVPQVYVRDIECSVERPVRELKGFSKVFLDPGERRTVKITLDEHAYAFYNVEQKGWRVEPGVFEIAVGESSRDLRLMQTIERSAAH
jgi:beta-glucosidase